MRIAVFSAKPYDESTFRAANDQLDKPHDLQFLATPLDAGTAVLAQDFDAVCAFVNDDIGAETVAALDDLGVGLVLMRCAGFNNVDVGAATQAGLSIGRVPAYSPHAVAEHTIGLLLALNRRLHRAYNRVREGNFALDGLMGFDIHGKTVGVVGTGRIGICVARILGGFGCRVLAHDPQPAQEARDAGAHYVPLEELLAECDIVTLHCPLTPKTHHLIDADALSSMRDGAFLVNTSRGGLVDTRAVIGALKSGRLGGLAIDVYEEEDDLFFENLSGQVLQDDVFARLLTFPNVFVTGHQAFFTAEALDAIARTTLANATAHEAHGAPEHPVTEEMVA
ncbi:D-lactate dehydrogenase [Jannaschia seosinensis]|uniref:D-lactate dehydrogenase n=1 Tax=Jannaschia seosinensis TaxID=313367 RepID=A0A0M7B8G7_9RHOB|nr:2-hydroxyacid dehydrogenase [Jannaschia seosinensis]CUH34911.1 D-lactate dehydrogenase [Jannaschia seosinensis]